MPFHVKAKLVGKEQLKPDIFKFIVESKEIAEIAKPGQFLEIRITDTIEPLLRRPISIYQIRKKENIVEFIFQVKGKGTKLLTNKQVGDNIDILGPLGYGNFKIGEEKNIAIIGGGIGTFPLYELAKNIKGNLNIYLGFRSKEYVVLEEEFKKVCNNLSITTDDGSYGEKGFAIKKLEEDIEKEKPDVIYACGPLPMLKAVKELAIKFNIPCQISLEEKMACGMGVCLGCAVKIAASPKDAPEYMHVCKAGPVFCATDVEI